MGDIEDLTEQPRYVRQWHLHESNELLGINAVGAWPITRGSRDVKVVVFDTGVDVIHPNLYANIVLEDARDFDHNLQEETGFAGAEIEELQESAAMAHYVHRERAREQQIAARSRAHALEPAQPSSRGLELRRARTGARVYNPHDAHGTASAGIVAAAANGTGCVGVAPECSIVPVRMSTNVELKSLIAAVKYAGRVGHVILMPRSLPWVEAASAAAHESAAGGEGRPASDVGTNEHPSLRQPVDPEAAAIWEDLKDEHGAAFWRALDDKREHALSAILYAAISEVAKRVPVVCASGNNGTGSLIYPACLKATIAVGACNEKGWRSTYSQYGTGLDLVAPSNDVPTRTKSLVRCSQDTLAPDEDPKAFGVERLGMYGIETTDNLGTFGYNPDPPGDYCEADGDYAFGGTSAAAAQVAGVVALMLSANRSLGPGDIKKILYGASDLKRLRGEPVEGEERPATKEEFGAGLIDAAEAVKHASKWVPQSKPASQEKPKAA